MKFKKIIVFMALIISVLSAFGCSVDKPVANTPEDVAEAFVNAYVTADYITMDEYSAISQRDMMADEMKYYIEEEGYTAEEYWKEVAVNYELASVPKNYDDFAKILKNAQKSYFKETFGKGYKIEVTATVKKTLTDKELPTFLEELKANEFEYKYFELDEISTASALDVTAVMSSKELDEPREEQFELLIVKINEKFKVLYVN